MTTSGASSGTRPADRIVDVDIDETKLTAKLADGRAITVPLAWYPRLTAASPAERSRWEICGGGFGIHWPDLDEDLSVEGMLRGAAAPRRRVQRRR